MKIFFLFLIAPVFASGFDWEGHRGARGLMPENTTPAMREALRYPVTTLELDVVVSKDKKIVVSHEPWFSTEFCQHPEGKVFKDKEFILYQMDYNEILRFDCGGVKHPRFPDQKKISVGKPLLAGLLREIEAQLKKEKRSVMYNVEIKSTPENELNRFQPKVPEFVDLVMTTIREFLPNDRFIIQSFDPRVLIYMKKKYPEIQLSYLSEKKESPDDVKRTLGFTPQIFSPDFNQLSSDDIPLFHAQGMRVIPWTVNNREDMKRLIGMGVDGIITDYPDLIEKVGEKECPVGSHLFEGECVITPKNALPSDKNPGWNCKSGYIQRRFHCDRIKVPSHAILSSDGKSWECKEKYERYRGRCRKKNKN
jgi:glycerophosphoryl diester phosphodiesterase